MREGAGAPDVELNPVADAAAMSSIDRRTLLLGAGGAVVAAGLSEPARAARHAGLLAPRPGPRFDPALARELQRALHGALSDPTVRAPGGILHMRSPTLGCWTGAAGLGR